MISTSFHVSPTSGHSPPDASSSPPPGWPHPSLNTMATLSITTLSINTNHPITPLPISNGVMGINRPSYRPEPKSLSPCCTISTMAVATTEATAEIQYSTEMKVYVCLQFGG
eukprot:PhF_6_TR36335/c0_g2_i2/m.53221